MPDFEKRTFWECETYEHFEQFVESSKGDGTHYKVSYGNLSLLTGGKRTVNYPVGWFCECPSFMNDNGPVKGTISRRMCKHILYIRHHNLRCGWSQLVNGGVPEIIDGVECCPHCGSKCVASRHGV